jgi:addiction module HigA family antidote
VRPIHPGEKMLRPIHPGEILKEEYLEPLELTEQSFAYMIGVSREWLTDLLQGKRDVDNYAAITLSSALHTSIEFWTNLQSTHDDIKLTNLLGSENASILYWFTSTDCHY